MNSKDAMLARIRRALVDVADEEVRVVRGYRGAEPSVADRVAVVGQFIDRVGEYKASVHFTTPRELPGVIAGLLAGTASSLIVPSGVPEGWLSHVDEDQIRTVADDPDHPLSPHQLAEFDAVLTGSTLGVALTGTIVLDGGPLSGRRSLTLVPDHHVCVIDEDKIVSTVPDAIAALDPMAPLTWISGPSATSDIELNRVEGVHGPRRLDVVVVGVG